MVRHLIYNDRARLHIHPYITYTHITSILAYTTLAGVLGFLILRYLQFIYQTKYLYNTPAHSVVQIVSLYSKSSTRVFILLIFVTI